MRPALALCLLCQAFWPGPCGAEHPTADRAGCSASGACYSLHHATIERLAAEEACSLRGGSLSTVHGDAELHAVLALLRAGPGPGGGSRDLLFWVALERGRSHCTLEGEPLRGFSWLSLDADQSESDTLPWVEEPQRSCTARRCAGLQASGGVEPAGWKEMRCRQRANGYLCKYQFEGLCPAPHPGAASHVSYRAPFQLYSSALDFSPPGTKVSARCPGELSISATCIQEDGGARWDGLHPGGELCPCPGRYLRAGRCSELSGCLDDLGVFVCECAAGFELGKDGRSCVTKEKGQPTPEVPAQRSQATAASPPETDGTRAPQVHQRPGDVPHATEPGPPATSTPETLQWGAHSTPTFQMSPQTQPRATTTPPGSVIPSFYPMSASSTPRALDSSSTVVFVLVSIAVVVLVILTMTVLGLFKLCFHKSPASPPRKGPLAPRAVESEAESGALRPSSAPGTDNGVKG